MKFLKTTLFLSLSLVCFSLISCESESLDNHQVNNQMELSQNENFQEIIENLDYFVGLYEPGDEMTIFIKDGKITQTLQNRGSKYMTFSQGDEHDFTSKNKIKFARWVDKQVKAGKEVKVGYNKNTGEYYGDIVK